jgi:hypothetical protein
MGVWMKKKLYLLVSTILSLLMFITSCSASDSKLKNTSQLKIAGNQSSESSQISSAYVLKELTTEEFLKTARKKGLTESQIQTLGNLGYLQQEILTLTDEKIAVIFAPGTNLDGSPAFIPDEKQSIALAKVGIDITKSTILSNLGYTYKEMLELTSTEIDFIFPNTKLVDNLVNAGFKREDVINSGAIWGKGKKNYKEVIKEALQR